VCNAENTVRGYSDAKPRAVRTAPRKPIDKLDGQRLDGGLNLTNAGLATHCFAQSEFAMKVSNTKEIGNKIKRSEVYHKQKREREAARQAERERRRKERESLGDDAPPVAPARTLDNTREWDDTVIDKNDPELLADEADDEFADIFSGERPAKIMMTTRVRATAPVYRVVGELLNLFPNSFYYKRGMGVSGGSVRSSCVVMSDMLSLPCRQLRAEKDLQVGR
jgi:hypothetical protein